MEHINKNLYKLLLIFVKFIPITLALIFVISTILNYYNISAIPLAYLGGSSFIFIGLLYIMSYVFKFCYLYRIPLYYITIVNIISITTKYVIIGISTLAVYRIYLIVTGLSLIIYIYYSYKNRNKTNNIDYIKNLCERYNCDCK
jgi:hypothetical protein